GPMKKHELHALQTGEVAYTKTSETIDETNVSLQGKITDLLTPIIVLFIATIGFIFGTGYLALDASERTMINILGEADVSLSLFIGGLIAVLVTFLLFIKHVKAKELTSSDFIQGNINGIKAMLSAVIILVFAWSIT